MTLTARILLVGLMLSLLTARPAAAQFSDQLPDAAYYLGVQAFYAGEYRDAERIFSAQTRRGLRVGQARWIDSICYHAMLGEVFYHQGRNAEALAEFDQACQLFLAYPNWMLQVRFQQPPRPDPNRARRLPPWGRSDRQFTLGQFSTTEQVLIGDVNANRALKQGGVAAMPMLWQVNVAEVIRTTALAMRRRNELLGPLTDHDRISKDLSETLSRGNLAPANHWSSAWIDLLRGIAQAGVGRLKEADQLLARTVLVDGRYDHPLTGVALLEQGRLAMIRGDRRTAAQLLAEAGFSAYYFEDWDVVTEAVWLGWLNHVTGGGGGVYPPLEPVAGWAQTNRFQHIAAKLRLAQAESLAWLGQLEAAASIAAETARRLDDMRTALVGIHRLYVQASLQLLNGDVDQGNKSLAQALAVQQRASARNFRIARTNEMFDAGAISPRVAVDLYGPLLADPTPSDWAYEPLDSMAVLQAPQDEAFERWFLAALARKELPLALEIADRAKRRRYLARQAFGGRLAALRTILEAPQAELSKEALLQRQQILSGLALYRELADAGQQLANGLRDGPIVPAASADARPLAAQYTAWEKNVRSRAQLLAQLVPRRLPSAIEFPPLRSLPQLQETLRDGEGLVVFHVAANNLYGFLISQADIHVWQIRNLRGLRSELGQFLRALGNYGANRQLPAAELTSDAWRDAAAAAFETVFAASRLDLDTTTGLVIVPDDVLWYLPFEALTPDGADDAFVLADRVAIRYGPTAALAVANPRPLRRPRRTGIVANEFADADWVADGDELIDRLEKAVVGPVRLPSPMPAPAYLVAPLLDTLISMDEIKSRDTAGWSALALPRSRSSADEASALGLPYGGPEHIIITNFATEAEQGLKGSRHGAARGVRPGAEVFYALCDMMASGARTILLTQWRTAGRTNFELVREFVRELPNSPATEAWQRAVLLARESFLDAAREPRLARLDESAAEPPTADHPFFWAGYLLVDTGPRPVEVNEAEPPADDMNDAPDGKKLPPPSDVDQVPADTAMRD